MDITIIKGSFNYINDCEDALVNSELGKRYFSEKGSARKALEEGFNKNEIYIALDSNKNCKGFIWIILNENLISNRNLPSPWLPLIRLPCKHVQKHFP